MDVAQSCNGRWQEYWIQSHTGAALGREEGRNTIRKAFGATGVLSPSTIATDFHVTRQPAEESVTPEMLRLELVA